MSRRLIGLSSACLVLATLVASPPATAVTRADGLVCPAPGGAVVAPAPTPTSGALVIDGHGWGHSLGLSQYGAQGAARLGCSAATILGTYYPGTAVVQQPLRPTVTLRLLTNEAAGRSTVTAQTGPLTWAAVSANKIVVQPRGETWTVQRRADLRGVVLLDAKRAERFWVADTGVLRLQQRGTVARVRSFGGSGTTARTDLRMRWDDTQFVARRGVGLSVDQVITDTAAGTAVQKYLWGLAEVPASWPSAALQAQAVAARTYLVAGYADAANPSAYRIGTTTATQRYKGFTHEEQDQAAGGAWMAAVDATDRQVVVTPDGAPISAFFTSSHGGRSEDIRYVFGGPEVSYLRAIDDSAWDAASDNRSRSWSVGLPQADVARRFGFDTVLDVRVAAPDSPERLAGVSVTGVKAGVTSTRVLSGAAARKALDVRSPGFTLRWLLPQTSQPISGDVDGDGRGDVGWFAGGRVSWLTARGVRYAYALGGPGDRAVVGDWDGNGSDSVGVVHNNTWCLRNALAAGACDLTFRFGTSSDTPVAGRWAVSTPVPAAAGTRAPDGIGVWRGGQWLLRTTPTAGPAHVTVAWGRASDVPVVGDWDGDGRDSQGIVRGTTWFVANTLRSRVPHATSFVYGKAGDRFISGTWLGGRRSYPATVAGAVFFQRLALSGGPVGRRAVLVP